MTVSENQIVVYQPNEIVRLDVRLENETVWLTQGQMATLFGCSTDNIGLHLKNIYSCGELDKVATTEESSVVQTEGPRKVSRKVCLYNLDAIISVGYRVNSILGVKFRQWATRVLREYLLHGQAVNQRLTLLEDKVDRRLAKHDSDIVELKDKVDFFVQTKELPLQGIFYQNRYWDAKSLLIKFIRRAKKKLIVIDAYPGVATLDMLAKRGRGVEIELVTHSNCELVESDFEAFGKQCGKFTKTICGVCHDRFIIVDGKEIFWTGASLKDAGRLTFAAAKLGAEVIPGLIDSIRKATSERREYGKGKKSTITLSKFQDSVKKQVKVKTLRGHVKGLNNGTKKKTFILANNNSNIDGKVDDGDGRHLNALSLFANVGIAETYLKDVGVDVVVANELLPERARFYQHLYPECNMICGDIQDPKVFKKILSAAKKAQVEFLIATPPCQGMSPAGKKDPFDPRNQLITYAVDMIDILQPKFVLLENVMQQLKTKVRCNGELILIPDYLRARLETHYHFNENPIIDTKFYGVPQQRKRAIFLLARKDTNMDWQFPAKEKKLVTLRDAIGQLPSLDPLIVEPEYRFKLPDYEKKREAGLKVSKWHYAKAHFWRHVEILQHTPEGQSARKNKVYFPKKSDNTPIKGAPRTYMRMSWDRPAPTITIQNASVTSFQTIHPGRSTTKRGVYSDPRVLSILELMRVSTLPDDWSIPEWASDSLIRRVIGEGIPPLLVKKIVAGLGLGGR